MMTLEELKTFMSEQLDEVEVLELLQLTSDQLVEVFQEKIEEDYDRIMTKLGLE
jgi:hypothetical protein